MEKELWKPVKGFEKWYEVSNKARIRSYYHKNGKLGKKIIPHIKDVNISRSYPFVILTRNLRPYSKPLHIIVAIAWVANSDPERKKYVNHLDGDKFNPMPDNLEWCTSGENQKHAYSTGLRSRLTGEMNGRNKITKEQALEIFHSTEGHYELATKYNVSRPTIGNIKNGKLWGTITGATWEKKYFNPLTDAIVIEIFKSPLKQVDLAAKYGVAQGTISTIKLRKRYQHLTKDL